MKIPRPSLRSVRLRLTLWNVAGLALLLVVLGAALRATLRANLTGAIDRHLSQDAARVQQDFDRPPPWGDHGPGDHRPFGGHGPFGDHGPDDHGPFGDHGPFAGPPVGANLPNPVRPRRPDLGLRTALVAASEGPLPSRALDLHGRGLGFPPGAGAWDADMLAPAAGGRSVYSDILVAGAPVRVLSVPLRREGRVVGVIQVASWAGGAAQEVSRLTHVLLTLIPLALLVAAAGGALLTGRTLLPVRQITEAAGRIEAQDLSGRLAVAGNDEFGALAATFNGMLGRLEGAFGRLTEANAELTRVNQRLTLAYEQQRRFTADASHELRTPLTVIKANTSFALLETHTAEEYQEMLAEIDRAADRTGQLVQDLLLLARSDAGQLTLKAAPLEMRNVLEQAVEAAGCRKDPRVCIGAPAAISGVVGNAGALVRLFSNLLVNAARHTAPEGQIVVTTERGPGQVRVTVNDTGEGIASDHLPHLFERFYRADESRAGADGGTGLGLAICRSIAEAHGGSIGVESTLGRGTSVCVTLPVSECPPGREVPGGPLN